MIGGRWPTDSAGRITIHYRIRTDGWTEDPTGRREAPPADEMIAMIRAAAQTWMDANPRLRLVYDGVTTDEPANGNNVIGWGNSPGGIGLASAHHTPGRLGPTYTGFHIIIGHSTGWSWEPCDPAAGQPCTDEPNRAADFQGVMVHEWGHVFGLAHPNYADAHEMTMYDGSASRSMQTLALGDVLGLRELYPTGASMPTIHRP